MTIPLERAKEINDHSIGEGLDVNKEINDLSIGEGERALM